MTTLYNGYVPPTDKLCLRCGQVFRSNLYQLCEDCQNGDDHEQNVADEFDRQEEISFAREGF